MHIPSKGGSEMALDMITKYYDKRKKPKEREYYNTIDGLFIAVGRDEYVGKYIIPSWLGIKNISYEKLFNEHNK